MATIAYIAGGFFGFERAAWLDGFELSGSDPFQGHRNVNPSAIGPRDFVACTNALVKLDHLGHCHVDAATDARARYRI